jgi:hypothetical protein
MTRVILAFALALVATPAPAPEFANALGTPAIEQASVDASGRALDGLGRILAAIRIRESDGLRAGGSALDDAADILRQVATDMKNLQVQLSQNERRLSIGDLQPPERQLVESVFSRFGGPPARQSDLFMLFAAETEHLAAVVQQAADAADAGVPVMPLFVNEMAFYLRLGSAVTVLARTAQP